MLTLSLLCLAGVAVLFVLLLVLSVPMALALCLLPWLLRVAAVVLLVKAILAPFRWQNYLPSAALLLAVTLL